MSDPDKTPAQSNPATDPDKTPAQSNPAPAASPATAEKAKGKPAVSKITVQGPAAGRWRAGRKFGTEPVDIPLADLTDNQLAAIKGDPALMYTIS